MIVLYIILGLIAVMLVVAAVMPGKYVIEKEIVIDHPPSVVFERIADFNYYRQWNPWQKSEPTAKYNMIGPPVTNGHRYEWEGRKIGSGSLTISSLNPYNSIELDLEFVKPWKSKALDNWKFVDLKNGSTKVIWHNSGSLPYPVARLMGPIISKNLNDQFVQGLNSLKEMCENK